MLSFGPYKFAPRSLRCSKEKRWSVVECIGKMPSLQNIGQGGESIEVEGIIYLNNLNGLNQLNSMKEAEKDQTPHILVDSLGDVLGRFVIMKLEKKQTSFFPSGLPKKVEFSLSLKRYT
ncbi:phage tail protein [Wolbachia endosymbiont of Chironomus riparius]|uniref:phage tail protein n=1 Tax=Wolbachia endosymbiont of Chironomus riparius TaxID=2883238 RepID=UPI00209F7FE7|nr:phage tail protein [Wolbachia endosymbiont of Chironomus riparius]